MPFPVQEQYIREAEEQLGLKLPRSYRDKLRVANGGEACLDGESWQFYPVRDSSERKRSSRTCNDLVQETRSAREWSGFPEDAVAIAFDGSGDLLILTQDDSSEPTLSPVVQRWDHETRKSRVVCSHVSEIPFEPR